MANNLLWHLPTSDPDTDFGISLAPRWKTWVADFQTYLIANDVADPKRKRAMLLFLAGPRVTEILRQIPDTGDDTAFETALEKLNSHYAPQTNTL